MHTNIIQKGIDKMKLMNLQAIRHMRNKKNAREQVGIHDSIYNNVMNTNSNTICYAIVEELLDKTKGNLLGTEDTEINSYI